MSVERLLPRQAGHMMPAYNTERGQRRAAEVGRRAHFVALAAFLQSKMGEVIDLCYEKSGSVWVNVEPVNGAILFGLPWAVHSHRNWGLYRSECDLMRAAVMTMARTLDGPFLFNPSTRRWAIDLATYPDLDTLLARPAAWTIPPEALLLIDTRKRAQKRA